MSILLDCGEGTFNQLVRFYGSQQTEHILARLSFIFISHLHADHHLGMIQLLKARESALKSLDLPWEPVTVAAPRFMIPWTARCHRTFEPVSHLFS